MTVAVTRRRFLGAGSMVLAWLFAPRRAFAAVLGPPPHPTPRPGITGEHVLSREQLADHPDADSPVRLGSRDPAGDRRNPLRLQLHASADVLFAALVLRGRRNGARLHGVPEPGSGSSCSFTPRATRSTRFAPRSMPDSRDTMSRRLFLDPPPARFVASPPMYTREEAKATRRQGLEHGQSRRRRGQPHRRRTVRHALGQLVDHDEPRPVRPPDHRDGPRRPEIGVAPTRATSATPASRR